MGMMPKKPKDPKALKEILSTDYHIPGIRPRYYLPFFLVSAIMPMLVVPNWYLLGFTNYFLVMVLVGGAISMLSTMISRLVARIRH